ncbi:hypothetical protein MRX96_050229 [Rhipicephalus microplus]
MHARASLPGLFSTVRTTSVASSQPGAVRAIGAADIDGCRLPSGCRRVPWPLLHCHTCRRLPDDNYVTVGTQKFPQNPGL